jgi:hypothetical protein
MVDKCDHSTRVGCRRRKPSCAGITSAAVVVHVQCLTGEDLFERQRQGLFAAMIMMMMMMML